PAATAEETECILRWLEQSGTRLVALDGEWSSPLHGAGRWQAWLTAADAAARESSAEADRPGVRCPAGADPSTASAGAPGGTVARPFRDLGDV
ncbi:MAG TPA: hypothetical protein VNC22_04320, partial [Sporichthya sp.]|nr:hypothetical protein [Sporichthya sp.]